ncbi:MAG: DUF4268 domain-containing protein [Acidobacteria bacterium]|nr:DUF4268 domain-containing protein [Acidobacteriota bacterium]
MSLYQIIESKISEVKRTTFEFSGLKERADLQQLFKKQIDVVAPGLMVVAEEFGEWDESRRRIDLLALDREANLVVIELKRTEDGGFMDLQAIRYAAMISPMTFDRVVEAHRDYLSREGDLDKDPQQEILRFLRWPEPDDERFGKDVKIVLVSADFSKELTTSVIWLNQRGLDIRCVRVAPYDDNGRILLDVQQLIPLPEAAEFQIQIREKDRETRNARSEQAIIRHRFWEGLLAMARDRSGLHAGIAPSYDTWISAGSGIGGVGYNYTIGEFKSRVELYISSTDPDRNLRLFDYLSEHCSEIETTTGQMNWQRLEGKLACRISIEIPDGGYRNDESEWPSLHSKLFEAMVRFEKGIAPWIGEFKRNGL